MVDYLSHLIIVLGLMFITGVLILMVGGVFLLILSFFLFLKEAGKSKGESNDGT